jgi:hypothetical protein
MFLALALCILAAPAARPGTSTALASTPTDVIPPVEAPQVAATAASTASSSRVRRAAITEEVVETSGISADVLDLALGAVSCAAAAGHVAAPPTLTVIDYSRPSTEPRLWVFDMSTGSLLFKELVAHGKNSGENFTTRFSDELNSLQSSLGLFVTEDTYIGSNGYSLRLNGLEPRFNQHARERAIVMHGAPYVDAAMAARQGRLGRSWGCPALRPAIARQVIDTIRGGSVIFSYYPHQDWLNSSQFLSGCAGARAAD